MSNKEEFDELYQYVKKQILNYDDNQSLPPSFVLRLKGLSEGKFMSNKNIKSTANYPYIVILATFKLCKRKIDYAIKVKQFKNEQQKFNYILAIINNNLNDVYLKYKGYIKQKELSATFKLDDIPSEDNYKRKTEDLNIDTLNNLW